MSLITQITHSAAGITATYTSLFLLFLLVFCVIYSLIIKRAPESHNLKEKLSIFVNDSVIRTPFGFMTMIAGLLTLFAYQIPKYAFKETPNYPLLYLPENGIVTIVHILAETLIFVGLVIIFWPTIKIISYKIFGVEKSDRFHENSALILAISVKFILTLIGIGVHFMLT